jgi:hypothetical protein
MDEMLIEENKKRITKLQMRLYYIQHKDEINQNRKKYRRQPWAERKDNPKNKRGNRLDD